MKIFQACLIAMCLMFATSAMAQDDIASFRVTKNFSDDNEAAVHVTIECNDGLSIDSDADIVDTDSGVDPGEFDQVTFEVTTFVDGSMDCIVTETSAPAGYDTSYSCGAFKQGGRGDSSCSTSEDGCTFTDVNWGDAYYCEVSNELQESTVTVTKNWIEEGHIATESSYYATARYSCSGEVKTVEHNRLHFNGNGDSDSFGVYPDWENGTTCSVSEVHVYDSGVEIDDSDCQSIELWPGVDGSCTITNTRWFEGIPTLSQYGLAVLALALLGVGFVGFRRFS